jgi:hypothetical protein
VLEAQAERNEAIRKAEAAYATFAQRSDARKRLGFDKEWGLFLRARDELLDGTDPAVVCDGYRARRARALQAHAALMDFRLYWETLGKALTGRELVLIDADKITGRRQLLFMDPEQWRVPVPVLIPPDRELRPSGP